MGQQIDIFNGLPAPKSHLQDVLFTLINQGQASIETYRSLPSFRTRISELVRKHNLFLKKEFITKSDKYGKKFTYVNHILPSKENEKAIEVYNKLQAKN